MFGEVGQALLDVLRFRPGLAADQGLVVVGEVHEGSDILAQAHGIDESEAQFAGRDGGQQAEQQGLDGLRRLQFALPGGFPQQLRPLIKGRSAGNVTLPHGPCSSNWPMRMTGGGLVSGSGCHERQYA